MRSLPKVIKTARLDPSDEVYRIPDDLPPLPPPEEEQEEAAGEAQPLPDETAPPPKEEIRDREAEQRRWEEERRRREKMLETEARQKAEELAQRILQTAKTEREKMLEQAQAEAGKIREEARKAGYQAAYQEKREAVSGRLAELDRLMERLQKDQKEFFRQYREGLSALALDIAQKLLDEAILQHKELMQPLVQKAVSSVKNTEWISVQVSDRLPGLAEELKQDLAGRPGLPPVDVVPGDGPAGTCVVHTPEGIVDASVSTQLENLKTLFEG